MSAGAGPAPRMRGDAGFAAGRAAMLLTAAFVVGVALLHSFDKGRDPYEQSLRTAVRRTTSTTTHTAVTSATTTTTPVHQPADVKVLPANGTAIAGAATKVGAELQRGGYNVLSATNGRQVQNTIVQYAPGYDADAAAIARVLGLADNAVQPLSTPPLVNDQRGANIVVIVGPDLVNQAGGGGATTATTTGNTTTTVRRTAPTFGRTTTTLGRTGTTVSRVTTTTLG